MTTVKAVLVTVDGRKAALLSADDDSNEAAVLTVDGVAYAPEDLPKGSYLKVRSPRMADQATMAGFFVGPPNSLSRRWYRFFGRLCGAVLLLGVPISLYWAVRAALALDLWGVLAWVALGLFVGLLGIYWWDSGDREMLDRIARNRRDGQDMLRALRSLLRR